MKRGIIKLENPERFSGTHTISEEKLDKAINNALAKLSHEAENFKRAFPTGGGPVYDENNMPHYNYQSKGGNWAHGMFTGCYLLAYDLTKDEKYLDVAREHMKVYEEVVADRRLTLMDHDVGFKFSPSSVAYHKLTGDMRAKRDALEAAKHLMDYGFSQEGGYILRIFGEMGNPKCNRTMVDTLFNIPLLYWAWEQTGNKGYFNAANSQVAITDECLVREDGSTNHHYQFESYTFKPLHGVTLQGVSDDSCWSRGHSWVVYGLPIALSYNMAAGDSVGHLQYDRLKNLHRDVVYFMLNHLPDDYIPYWDYDFVEGNQPRDTSAAAIAVCGLLEMCNYLDDSAPEKTIYKNAASKMLEAIMDRYTSDDITNYAGLIGGVSDGNPERGLKSEISASYGDYFYLEALIRFKNSEWKKHW